MDNCRRVNQIEQTRNGAIVFERVKVPKENSQIWRNGSTREPEIQAEVKLGSR